MKIGPLYLISYDEGWHIYSLPKGIYFHIAKGNMKGKGHRPLAPKNELKKNILSTKREKILKDVVDKRVKPKSQIVVNEYLAAIITLTNNNI